MSDMRKFLNAIQLNEDENEVVYSTENEPSSFDLTKKTEEEILNLEPGVVDAIRANPNDYNVKGLAPRQMASLQKRYKEVQKSGIRKGEGQSFNGKNNSHRKSPDKRLEDPAMFSAIQKLRWVAMDANTFSELEGKYPFTEVKKTVKREKAKKAIVNDEGQIQDAYDLKKEKASDAFLRKYAPENGSVKVYRASIPLGNLSEDELTTMLNDGFVGREVKPTKGNPDGTIGELTVVVLPNTSDDDSVDTRTKYLSKKEADKTPTKLSSYDQSLIAQGYEHSGNGFYTKTITVPKPKDDKNGSKTRELLSKYKSSKSGAMGKLTAPKIVDKGNKFEITLKEPSRSMKRSMENEIINTNTVNQKGGFDDENSYIEDAGEDSNNSDAIGGYEKSFSGERAGSFLKNKVKQARREYQHGGKDVDSINTLVDIIKDPAVTPKIADEAYDKLWKLTVGMCTSNLRHEKGITEENYADLIQVFGECLYYATFMYKPGKSQFATYVFDVFKNAVKNYKQENSNLASAGRGSSRAAKSFFAIIDEVENLSNNDSKGPWDNARIEREVCNRMDAKSGEEFKIGPKNENPSNDDYHEAFLKAEQKFAWAGFTQGISTGDDEEDENGNLVPSGAMLQSNTPAPDADEDDTERAEKGNEYISLLIRATNLSRDVPSFEKFKTADAKWLVYGLGLRGPSVKSVFGAESDRVYFGPRLGEKIGSSNPARQKDATLNKLAKAIARISVKKDETTSVGSDGTLYYIDQNGNKLTAEQREEKINELAAEKYTTVNNVLNAIIDKNRKQDAGIQDTDWDTTEEKNRGINRANMQRSDVFGSQADKLAKDYPFLKARAQQIRNDINSKEKMDAKLHYVKNTSPDDYARMQELGSEIEHLRRGKSLEKLDTDDAIKCIELQNELIQLRDKHGLSSADDTKTAKEALRAIQNVAELRRVFISPDKEKVEPNEPVMPYSTMDPVTNKPTRNASHLYNDEMTRKNVSNKSDEVKSQIKQQSPEDYSKLISALKYINNIRDIDTKAQDYSMDDVRSIQNAYKTILQIYTQYKADPAIITNINDNIAATSQLLQQKLNSTETTGGENKSNALISKLEYVADKVDIDNSSVVQSLDDNSLQSLIRVYNKLVKLYSNLRDKAETRECLRKREILTNEMENRKSNASTPELNINSQPNNEIDFDEVNKVEVPVEYDAFINAEVAIDKIRNFKSFAELDINSLNKIRDIFVKLGKEYPDFVKSPNIRKTFNEFMAAFKSKAQ